MGQLHWLPARGWLQCTLTIYGSWDGIDHPQDALPIHTFQSSVTTSFKSSMYSDQLHKIVTWWYNLECSYGTHGLGRVTDLSLWNGNRWWAPLLFECPHYHKFWQLLEQSVQDTLLTGPNSVAVNLSVSLLLAPWTNNSLSRRQCTDILEATFVYIQQAGRRLWSAFQLIARSCISILIKQQNNKNRACSNAKRFR